MQLPIVEIWVDLGLSFWRKKEGSVNEVSENVSKIIYIIGYKGNKSHKMYIQKTIILVKDISRFKHMDIFWDWKNCHHKNVNLTKQYKMYYDFIRILIEFLIGIVLRYLKFFKEKGPRKP